MIDTVDPQTRSRMMSGIRGRNTKPELLIRSALHRRGFRFRLHDRSLPGTPDLVLPKYRAVIYIHGCFWHGHEGCRYFRIPSTRTVFWSNKIEGNRSRDARQIRQLGDAGWRVLVIWECALKARKTEAIEQTADGVSAWLHSSSHSGIVDGSEPVWSIHAGIETA